MNHMRATREERLLAGGCICGPPPRDRRFKCGYRWRDVIRGDCGYHNLAKKYPGDHGIPWNCPTYYDGCNCAAEVAA